MSKEQPQFWATEQGLALRRHMLSELLVIKTYNRTLQVVGPTYGVKTFTFTTSHDERVCPICAPRDGKTYRTGQFMPTLPQHIGCRCYFVLGVEQVGG